MDIGYRCSTITNTWLRIVKITDTSNEDYANIISEKQELNIQLSKSLKNIFMAAYFVPKNYFSNQK